MRLTLTFLAVFFAQISYAQVDLDATVTGFPTRTPLPNITVQLKNPSTGFSATAVTNELGKARFKGLSLNGNYELSIAESTDYEGTTQTGIELISNTNQEIQLVLVQKNVTLPEVRINGASKINTQNAEVASVLKQKEIEMLPLEGRDITRLLYRLPNVVQATGFFPEAPNVSINGSNALFTNYLIDGMDNNERFLGGQKFNIPVGFTKNIQVLTNNFSTEYGNTGNGIVNITSRSGSNQFQGEAFVVTRPGAVIDASSPYAQRDLSGNQVKDGFQRYQAGVGFGGALKKDKTFYYLNAEYTRDLKDNLLNSNLLAAPETVRGENNFTYLSGKLDQHWSKRFHSALRANIGIVSIARQGGGLEGGVQFPTAANFQDRNSALLALQNTYLGDNFKSETNLQYSRFRWNYGRALQEGPQVVVLDPQGLTSAILGHPGYFFDATENTVQVQQKVTYYLQKHKFKAGFDLISADHLLAGGGNVNGNYLVQLNQAQFNQVRALQKGSNLSINDLPSNVQVLNYGVELRPNQFGTRQTTYGLYLEDDISLLPKLNLTLGLRYDYDNLSVGGGKKGDYNNIAPRTSFNYKLTSTSSLRGGYGIFYDKILYAIYSDALQQNTTSADYKRQLQSLVDQGILPADTDLEAITFDGNFTATQNNVGYLQGSSYNELQGQREGAFSGERRILNPNGYQNPYTHQATLGYQKQLDAQRLFYVDLMYNQSRNLFRLRDLNAPSAYYPDPNQVVVRTTAQADLTRPVPIINGQGIINGDTVSGVARNIVVSETAGKSEYVALSFNLQKEKGEDKYAYRLIYTLSRLYNNTEDINFRARSFGDAYVGNSDRQPGEARNSDRLPWSNTLDLSAVYALGTSGAQLRVDIFNVFNAVNLSGYSNNASQSNQIQVGPASSGLLVRRNAAPPRQFQFSLLCKF